METYTFRDMTVNDLPFCNEVRNECRTWLHDSTEYSLDECVRWFHTSHPRFFIVELAGEKIGYFRTSNWNLEHHLVSIGADFHKDKRGKGHARPAYNQFMAMLTQTYGIQTFFLEVLSHNVVARHLYEQLGFVEFSTRKDPIASHRLQTDINSVSMFRQVK